MSQSEPVPESIGQQDTPSILGAYLLGMIDSFDRTSILNVESLPFSYDHLESSKWYPFDHALALVKLISKTLPDGSHLLFWAGVNFISKWYWDGPGKELVQSGAQWIQYNYNSNGYSDVVRGPKNEVGWVKNLEYNYEAGYILVESVTPWGSEYIRGVMYGGFLLFDDFAYFDVEIVSITQAEDLPFQKTIIKYSFRLISDEERAPDFKPDEIWWGDHNFTRAQVDEYLFRLKLTENQNYLRNRYQREMEELLKSHIAELRITQKNLVESNKQLQIEATTDSLSGLRNRRYFYQQIQPLSSIANRRGLTLSAMIIDIDYFKLFNDHYGHFEGDEVIKKVAECIKDVFKRGEDLVCRFGGEEFVCVCLNLSRQEVADMAQRLMLEIESERILHARSKVSDYLTVTIGSSLAKPGNIEIEELLVLADQALYKAKEQGRDRHLHLDSRRDWQDKNSN